MIVRDFLKNVDLFKVLDEDQLTAVSGSFHEKEYKQGDKLLTLEAMKMENNIDSDKEGVVKSVKVKQGDSVLEGDTLIEIGS